MAGRNKEQQALLAVVFDEAKTTTHIRSILKLGTIQSAQSIMYQLVKKGLVEKTTLSCCHAAAHSWGPVGGVRSLSVIYQATPAGIERAKAMRDEDT